MFANSSAAFLLQDCYKNELKGKGERSLNLLINVFPITFRPIFPDHFFLQQVLHGGILPIAELTTI